jgi:hypothetical protein
VLKLQLHKPGGGYGTVILMIFINLHSFSNTITLHEENNSFLEGIDIITAITQ